MTAHETCRTGFVFDPLFLKHDTGIAHPERPERLERVLERLKSSGLDKRLRPLSARPVDEKWLQMVHTRDYVLRAKDACLQGAPYLDTPDVPVSADSYHAALAACGGALALGDAVIAGKIQNGFALLRPPGHHAETNFAMGFCLFNNAAVCARYLQKKHGIEKVLILDWDVHHGNGTQHIFEEDPSVLYISLHQFPFYPGTGAHWETGTGRGRGYTLNCPMRSGASDGDYRSAFHEKVIPAIRSYAPQVIILSSGFDAHQNDPLGNINLSTDCFGWMTQEIMALADQFCGKRIISLLEGGYDLAALADCAELHIQKLSVNASGDTDDSSRS